MITLDFRPRRARRGAPAGAWLAAVLGLALIAVGLGLGHIALNRAAARRDAQVEEGARRLARQRAMLDDAQRLTGQSRTLAIAARTLDTLVNAPTSYGRVIALLAGALPARSPVAAYLAPESLVVSGRVAPPALERLRQALAGADFFDSLAVRSGPATDRTVEFRLVARPGASRAH